MDNDLWQQLIQTVIDVGRDLHSRKGQVGSRLKSDGSIVTDADIYAHNSITKAINQLYHDPIISEESEEPIPTHAQRYWLIDPIDGTRDYARGGSDYSINIALIEHNTPTQALIAFPSRYEVYTAIANRGAFCNGVKLRASERQEHFIGTVSQDFPDKDSELFNHYFAKKVTGLVASQKFAAVAKGDCDLYPRFTGPKLWDIAAGDLLVRESSGACISVFGGHQALNYHLTSNLTSQFKAPPFICASNRFIEFFNSESGKEAFKKFLERDGLMP